MPFRTLRDHDGTPYVNIPKDDLIRDGVVREDGSIDDQQIHVERAGEGCYVVRFADENGEVSDLAETDVVRREVASEIVSGPTPTAD